jgi:hypothetical protein
MTTKNITFIFLAFIGILMYNGMLIQRDKQLFKAYDACQQFTHHPDCPDSWKAKPAFSRL